MIPRFYCPPVPHGTLSPGAQLSLPPAASHHALKVLRLRAGAPLVLFDGRGGEWQAELTGKTGAGGTVAEAILRTHVPRECESPLEVTLVQALPAGDKMDWIIEKCVELGIAAIQPVAAKRSVIRLSAERMARRIEHWQAVAVAACEQSGRNRVPAVAPVLDLPQYLGLAQVHNAHCMILAPAGEHQLAGAAPPSGRVCILVGPEGGWEEGELRAARAAGCIAVRLGPRVLRTETAGMAALAAMQALWGDF